MKGTDSTPNPAAPAHSHLISEPYSRRRIRERMEQQANRRLDFASNS